MSKKKAGLAFLIGGGVLLLGGIAYMMFKKEDGQNDVESSDTEGAELKPEDICAGEDNWKARGALTKGLYIPEGHIKRYPDQTDCELLGWMYELKYGSGDSWAKDYSLQKLVETAEWQWWNEKFGKEALESQIQDFNDWKSGVRCPSGWERYADSACRKKIGRNVDTGVSVYDYCALYGNKDKPLCEGIDKRRYSPK